jgi:5'-3' exonuclease
MKFETAIVDADVLCYRCGFSVEKFDRINDILEVEPVENAFYNVDLMVNKIQKVTVCSDYKMYLTSADRSNFRFGLFPEYKQHRKKQRKPYYYNELRDYLQTRWKAEMVSGEEADDKCSIEHCLINKSDYLDGYDCYHWNKDVRRSVLCSIDKDFNNVPGWHYNFVNDRVYYVGETEALRTFYLQILTGDDADGIPRIKKGWRQKKIEALLSKAETERQMLESVKEEVIQIYPDLSPQDIESLLLLRGRLVWLRRKENELWQPIKV